MNFKNLIQNSGKTQRVPAGTMLFSIYDRCDHYVLVLDGQVRVELSSITGQQLTLYRIYAGQTCVLTTACLLSGENYSAQAVTETDVDIVLMPKSEFDRMLGESAGFRQFVFDGFSERLSTMLQRTSELATYSIDQRLAAALLAHCEWQGDPILNVTHEALAVEIGTAREVVSRRLGIFEKNGLLKRHRKYLEILDETGLRQKLAS
jgi:CRP/FNR family transcriptional regulator